jgi:hypothetical protein
MLTAISSLIVLTGVTVWQRWLPAALWHLVLGAAAMPMILAAMRYFTPVLTRTPAAPKALVALPLMALLAGLGIVGWFVLGKEPLRLYAPWLALAAATGLAIWMVHRRRACLGPPHACLAWYAAALFCLGLGLAAVGVSAYWPAYANPLRTFHLHINTIGFMGLTAIGTLQVLLPTVLGRPDPAAARRLILDLPWSLAGALSIAVGAATDVTVLWIAGAGAYAWPLLRLIRATQLVFADRLWQAGQAAPLLMAAVAGLALCLAHGVAHGGGQVRARDVLPLFVIGFLLPLVSGAVTQLLPVWLRPGGQPDWQRAQRAKLSAFARLRAALLLMGGLLAAMGSAAAPALGIVSASWLIALMLLAAGREIRTAR